MWVQEDKQFSRYGRKVIFNHMSLTVTLNLKTANQSSCMTLWPIMMHHHSKCGYRRFSSWGDIVHWNSEPSFDLGLDHNRAILSFSQDNPTYDGVPSNQVNLHKDQQFRTYNWRPYFDYIILHCDLDREDSKPISLKDTLAHDDASLYQVWQ